MLADGYADLQEKISTLINDLHSSDSIKRQRARHALTRIGWDATPALIDVVLNEEGQSRWEAIEALEQIRDPKAAKALVEALMDDETGTRWAASNALIALDRAAIKPLLIGLTKHFDSEPFREVAHHVFHVLKDRGRLLPKENKVFETLDDFQQAVEVPWAAEAALEDLE